MSRGRPLRLPFITETTINSEPFESPFQTPFYYGYFLYRQNISGMLATKTIMYGKQVIKDIEYVKSETVRNIPADVFSGTGETGIHFAIVYKNGEVETFEDNGETSEIKKRLERIEDKAEEIDRKTKNTKKK